MKKSNVKSKIILLILMLFTFKIANTQTLQYLDFDGVDDYVNVPNASFLVAGTNAISITGWFKVDALGYGHGMIGIRDEPTTGFYLIELNNGQIECRIISGGILTTVLSPANTVVPNVWQHYAWVYDGANLKLYLNGAVVASGAATGAFSASTTSSFAIGLSTLPGFNFYYDGGIDEVSLWNKALTQTEIQNMMANGLTGTETGLKLYYKFNQGIPGGNNSSISKLLTMVNSPTYDGDLLSFALNGTTSNFVGTMGPIVVTNDATAITSTTATLNGTANANGNSTAVTFEYWSTSAPGATVNGVPATVTGTTTTNISANITGLVPGTLYEYRIEGVNSVGQTFGQNKTFTTAGPPTVVTNTATAVTGTAAKLNGTVTANNASTAVSFNYGTTTSYGTTVAGTPTPVAGSTATNVSANITGLLPGTLYHYRVVGANSYGTTNGTDMTFTTTGLPIVVTNTPTNITATSAKINGTITANGISTTASFEWGTTTAYGGSISALPATVTGSSATAVSADLVGLTPGGTYHYRCKGVSSAGTAYGADQLLVLQGSGIEETTKGKFTIYPVPNNGQFVASIAYPGEALFVITVYNELGAMVYQKKDIHVIGLVDETIDIRPMLPGVYTVVFANADNNIVSRILIDK